VEPRRLVPAALVVPALATAIVATTAYDVTRLARAVASPGALDLSATVKPSHAGAPTRPSASSTWTAPADRPEPTAWTRASVATVWLRPARVRPVDRPALRAKPDIDRWLNAQSITQRQHLDRRVLTQAVHGETVRVLAERSGWTKVRLPDQRGSFYRDGIIGWVPSRQLTRHPAPAATPARPLRATADNVMRLARGYLGVRYLWGGMTTRGIDCSGLTYRVFHGVGMTLPRDAADQSRVGRPVVRRDLQPGDLVFFGPGRWPTIHHVGIYAGGGLVLHAPYTGSQVRLTPLSAWSDYWGARRYL
jgi:cell wall-associated NlpC family hydrolase